MIPNDLRRMMLARSGRIANAMQSLHSQNSRKYLRYHDNLHRLARALSGRVLRSGDSNSCRRC
jgi:hypothetical protein